MARAWPSVLADMVIPMRSPAIVTRFRPEERTLLEAKAAEQGFTNLSEAVRTATRAYFHLPEAAPYRLGNPNWRKDDAGDP